MNKNFLLSILAGLSVMLGGCASTPWTASYEGFPDFRTAPGYVAEAGTATIHPTTNFHRDRRELVRRGYVQLGSTNFAASPPTAVQLVEFADRLGAHKVLYHPGYLKSAVDASPLVISADPPASSYVPAPVNFGAIGAIFLAKTTARVGLSMLALDDATQRRIGSEQALLIDVVVDGSPAHRADVRPGDILLTVDGRPFRTEAGANNFSQVRPGQSVLVKLRRGDEVIDKSITLN